MVWLHREDLECHWVLCCCRSRGRSRQPGSLAPLARGLEGAASPGDPSAGWCAAAIGGSRLGESPTSSSDGNLSCSGSTAPAGALLGRAKGKKKGRSGRCAAGISVSQTMGEMLGHATGLGGSVSPGQWLWALRWSPLHPLQCRGDSCALCCCSGCRRAVPKQPHAAASALL